MDTELYDPTVRYVNFERITSECANVSHICLPYWVRSRGLHSVCIVFYNEFDTFAEKVTTVTHFEHTAIKIILFYNEFETLISECATVSHIGLPYWARSRGYHSLCLVFQMTLTHSL